MQTYIVKLTNGASFTASAFNIFALSRELAAAGVPVWQIIPADLA